MYLRDINGSSKNTSSKSTKAIFSPITTDWDICIWPHFQPRRKLILKPTNSLPSVQGSGTTQYLQTP